MEEVTCFCIAILGRLIIWGIYYYLIVSKICYNIVDMELHPLLKFFIKSFCICVTLFFLQFSFFYLIYSLDRYNSYKPAPGDHESNSKKVVAIPYGCNTKWTLEYGCTKSYGLTTEHTFCMNPLPLFFLRSLKSKIYLISNY